MSLIVDNTFMKIELESLKAKIEIIQRDKDLAIEVIIKQQETIKELTDTIKKFKLESDQWEIIE
jgi:hypothetical protein